MEHGGMKTPRPTFAAIYSEVVATGWSMLTGRPPPPKELTPKEAQVAANQEWEDEGGSIKPPEKKPGQGPEPKMPL
jgi:hypothetical protein